MNAFELQTYGKWILTGEHTVVRGGDALAFPARDFQMKFSWSEDFQLSGDPELLGFLDWVKEHFEMEFGGRFDVQSNIPAQASLGSSAAFSVAFSKFIQWKGFLREKDFCKLAQEFENYFHGTSSGLDTTVVAFNCPIFFSKKKVQKLHLSRLPYFSLHDTQLRARTKDCIAQVFSVSQTHPDLFEHLDHQMNQATELAMAGLKQFEKGFPQAFENLKQAMNLSKDCFEQWGLMTPAMHRQGEELLKRGALAFKPTGKGLGGMLLALWEDRPLLNEGESFG